MRFKLDFKGLHRPFVQKEYTNSKSIFMVLKLHWFHVKYSVINLLGAVTIGVCCDKILDGMSHSHFLQLVFRYDILHVGSFCLSIYVIVNRSAWPVVNLWTWKYIVIQICIL